MKLRIKSLILATAITATVGVQAYAISLSGTSTGKTSTTCYCSTVSQVHEIGVSRSRGVFSTYGYSWVGVNNESLYTLTYIGTKTKQATGFGWAQTPTWSAGGTTETVSENHGNY